MAIAARREMVQSEKIVSYLIIIAMAKKLTAQFF